MKIPGADGFWVRCKQAGKQFRKNRGLLLMTVLPAIKIFVFSYLTLFGVIIAFKNFRAVDGIFGSEWVGLKNFQFFFKSNDAWRILRNTIVLSFVNIILGLIVNVIVSFYLLF